MKSKLISLVLLVVSVTISLAGVEVVLRIKNSSMRNYDIEMWKYSKELKKISDNPVLGHEHIPSSSAILQSVQIRTNKYGLRGAEISPDQNIDRRILFLGSSITLGWSVEEKDTMTAVLQDLFKKDAQRVEVLNAGIGNYNTVRYVERFFAKLEKIQPTDIVVHYFINDAEMLRLNDSFILRKSQLAVTLWTAINRYFSADVGLGALVDHYRSVYDSKSEGFQEMVASLKKLSAYAHKNNIRLYLAVMPDVHNLLEYQFGFIHAVMANVAERLNYEYIDLFPAFANIKPQDIWSMPGDPHPNAKGHALMATTLYPHLALTKK